MAYFLCSIVLEAGYFLQDRAFFDNIGTILLYAVVVSVDIIYHRQTAILQIGVCPVMPLFLPINEAVHGMELSVSCKDRGRVLHFVSIMIHFFLSLALCREQSSILSLWVSINFDCCLVDSDDFFSSIRLFFIIKQNG